MPVVNNSDMDSFLAGDEPPKKKKKVKGKKVDNTTRDSPINWNPDGTPKRYEDLEDLYSKGNISKEKYDEIKKKNPTDSGTSFSKKENFYSETRDYNNNETASIKNRSGKDISDNPLYGQRPDIKYPQKQTEEDKIKTAENESKIEKLNIEGDKKAAIYSAEKNKLNLQYEAAQKQKDKIKVVTPPTPPVVKPTAPVQSSDVIVNKKNKIKKIKGELLSHSQQVLSGGDNIQRNANPLEKPVSTPLSTYRSIIEGSYEGVDKDLPSLSKEDRNVYDGMAKSKLEGWAADDWDYTDVNPDQPQDSSNKQPINNQSSNVVNPLVQQVNPINNQTAPTVNNQSSSVIIPPVVIPQSSDVLASPSQQNSQQLIGATNPNQSTNPYNFQQSFSQPPAQQVQPIAPHQNIISSVLKSVQNNGKLINQGSDPVFDYIKQQQANSIYPDLGNTTNADYYPSAGVMSTSTSDPMYGSFNQYATQSLTPYAIYDKRNTALQKAAAASLPSGMTNKVPDAYVSYKDDVGEKTLSTTQDYIAEGQKMGYGKYIYEILEKGIGELGQRYQRDISNINTIASKTKDIGKYVDDIWLKESEGAFLPTPIKDAINKFRSGATDLWSGKGTDLELDKLVGQIQSAPNMMATISANKFAQDEYTTMIQDSGLKGIGQNKELTYQEIKQVLKPRADKLAEEIWNSNSQYKQYYTKDQISNMIIESNGQQVKDVYKTVSQKNPSTNININNGVNETTKDLVFQESGTLTINQGYYPVNGASTITGSRPTEVKYDYGLTLPEDARTKLKVKNTDIKKHNLGDSGVDSMSPSEFSTGDAIGIYRLPIKKGDGRIFPEGNTDNMGWFALIETPIKVLNQDPDDPNKKVVGTETHQYYVPFDQSLQQQFGYTVKELDNKIQKDIQLSDKLNVEPDVPSNVVGTEDMRVFEKYGTDNGRRVVRYTNGDIEYAD